MKHCHGLPREGEDAQALKALKVRLEGALPGAVVESPGAIAVLWWRVGADAPPGPRPLSTPRDPEVAARWAGPAATGCPQSPAAEERRAERMGGRLPTKPGPAARGAEREAVLKMAVVRGAPPL